MSGVRFRRRSATERAAAAQGNDLPQGRSARNMYPCTSEVALCDAYGVVVDEARAFQEPRFLDRMHVDPRFFACRATRTGNAALKTSTPVLHTLRGRLKMRTSSWVCRCGKDVPYDGANDGLFAVSIATMYTRTTLDSVLSLCVVGRTTMSSAAAVLAGHLRDTMALEEHEVGLHGKFCQTLSASFVAPSSCPTSCSGAWPAVRMRQAKGA